MGWDPINQITLQDLDFQRHMSWSFFCLVSEIEMRLVVFFILVELMAITVEAYFRRESIVCFVDMGGIVDLHGFVNSHIFYSSQYMYIYGSKYWLNS
jgi:hypothetical protein